VSARRHLAARGLATWLACAALASGPAAAGEFVINPLRLSLDRATRSGEVVVRNDAKAPLRMQVQAMAWSQDADGADRYEPTDDLLYFPRTMEVPPGQSRIVRVGVRAAPVKREEAYRLFVEELPPAGADEAAPGASLRVFLRVGVAVFVAPATPERAGEIARLALAGRQAEWSLVNTGNVHIRADQVELRGLARDGTRLFTHVFPERYFLSGATRTLRLPIGAEHCGRLAVLEAAVVADRLDVGRKLDVAPGSCN
jgi:fimbrial chaperone protein